MAYKTFDARVTWGTPIPSDQPVGGPNERCIELPLALELLDLGRPGRVLDAGCAINGYIPEDGVLADVHHLTQHLASERIVIPISRGITRSYLAADLRNLSLFNGAAFDRTVCISTLEHVGLDNTVYGGPVENCPDTMLKAFKELCRVTRSRLLITVPYSDPPVTCSQWRFFGKPVLGRMVQIAQNCGYQTDLRFYGKCEGGWYGGQEQPVDASREGFPNSVNAIACLRCVQ